MDNNKDTLNIAAIRQRLSQEKGKRFWRSLEEVAETQVFQEFLHREFPQQASEWPDAFSRRNFLKLMGASLALAGLTACASTPREDIVPYVRAPEEIVPGKPLFFATAMFLGGYASGVLAESHMGRPTKIEGNPDHPASLGATDVFAQASILTLYDPDRSPVVSQAGRISTWEAFQADFNLEVEAQRRNKGAGLRILTETVTSPTLADQLQQLLTEFPQAQWHQYEPVSRDNVKAGARLAFGEIVETQYRFDQADVVVALDADFVAPGPGHVRYVREFMNKRRVRENQTTMNRLYVVESTPTSTGSIADHRLALRAGQIEGFARALAQELGILEGQAEAEVDATQQKWGRAIADDLRQHQGAGLVIVGDAQPAEVHALAHAINIALGNTGSTVVYTEPVEANPVDHVESLGKLVEDIAAGQVELLVMIGSNPVYNAPVDFEFAGQLEKVKFKVHMGLYEDETSFLCNWHIPQTHYLEAWSDGRAFDGTATVIQPLIAPLYDGRSAHQLLALLLGQTDKSDQDIIKEYWQKQNLVDNFEPFWQKSLHDGVIADTAFSPKTVELKEDGGWKIEDGGPRAESDEAQSSLEIIFRPDPTVWDGRFANNGWLQELPKPLTKLTWDNTALVSPATAERLGLATEDVVQLSYRDRSVHAPVWILPGHATDSITVFLGYGRSRVGAVGENIGYNAYDIRTSQAPWFDSGLEISQTGQQYPLVTTQDHHSMEGRNLVRVGTLAEFEGNPEFVHEIDHNGQEISLYPDREYHGNAWGMSIDLTSCTGCNACVVACQSENNIPIVGKEQVMNGREMHWLRIDRYYAGDLDNPHTYHQPVLCMQCENAPCEVVCPVAATVHSAEGLNDMVYNRCVGTRYCSNNCPYKVRRFNFLQYNDPSIPTFKLLHNPDVTVRTKGVMEKCTYCVQRINAARIEAKKENRPIRDGEVVTACQAACPTQAIVFGNINDSNSEVAKLKAQPLNYGLLGELNTRPRTTYLARLRNPNPELETG